jgi:DNA repair exonuclease SbcCD ATPase subunit
MADKSKPSPLAAAAANPVDADPYLTEVHGKLAKYAVLKDIYKQKKTLHSECAIELKLLEQVLLDVATEYRKLYAELQSLKAGGPEKHRHLFSDVEPFCETPIQAVGARPSECSLTKLILNAAYEVRNLEHRQEMLQMMLVEKTKLIEKLDGELGNRKHALEQMEEQIGDLNSDIARMKEDLSSSSTSGQVASYTAEVADSSHCHSTDVGSSLDDGTDPVVLNEKIKELRQRILELMNHNQKWNEICEQLTREVDLANEKLRKVEGLLRDEKDKMSAVQVERDNAVAEAERQSSLRLQSEELCRQLRDQVAHLEMNVRQLEEQLARTEEKQPRQQQSVGQSSNTNEQVELLKLQLETYKEDFESEHMQRQRAEAKAESLDQQWRTLYGQLVAKTQELAKVSKERDKEIAEKKSLEQLLCEAHVDRELIERCLIPTGRSQDLTEQHHHHQAAATTGRPLTAAMHTAVTRPLNPPSPRRGRLEEDSACNNRLHSYSFHANYMPNNIDNSLCMLYSAVFSVCSNNCS